MIDPLGEFEAIGWLGVNVSHAQRVGTRPCASDPFQLRPNPLAT